MPRKVRIDWITIEGQYRANVMSIRAIAREHAITEGAIRKRAKEQDWSRNPESLKADIVRSAFNGGNESTRSSEQTHTVDPRNVHVQAGSHPVRRADFIAGNELANAALEDIRDMRAGLYNARRALEIAGEYLDTQFDVDQETGRMIDPRFLKAVMEASAAAVDQIRKIRDLDNRIPDEMEALKLLVSAGWMPDELLASAFQEYRTIKPSMKNLVRSYFQSQQESGNPLEG